MTGAAAGEALAQDPGARDPEARGGEEATREMGTHHTDRKGQGGDEGAETAQEPGRPSRRQIRNWWLQHEKSIFSDLD